MEARQDSSLATEMEASFVTMGFPVDRVRIAIAECNYDQDATIQHLLDHAHEPAPGAPTSDSTIACPICTLKNVVNATLCEVCSAELPRTETPWACAICCETASNAQPFPLECCSARLVAACVRCYQQHICVCDETGQSPTCLACDTSSMGAGRGAPLNDADIKAILGEPAHSMRAERLLQRIGGLFPCPTPNCNYLVALEEGRTSRRTTCPRCLKVVTIGETVELDAPLAADDDAAASAEADDDDDADAAPTAPTLIMLPSRSSAATRPTSGLASGSSSEARGGQQADRLMKRRREEASTEDAQEDARAQALCRSCPNCRQGIEKDPASCDKFQCICGCRFCWRCGTRANAAGEYLVLGSCTCECTCTGREHVPWDNVRGKPDGRKRLQFWSSESKS